MIGILVDLIMDLSGLRRKSAEFGKELAEKAFANTAEDSHARDIADHDTADGIDRKTGSPAATPARTKKKRSKKMSTQEKALLTSVIILTTGVLIMLPVLTNSRAAKTKSTAAKPNGPDSSRNAEITTGAVLPGNNPGYTVDIPSTLLKNRKNVLYFHSKMCPSCKQMDPLLQRLAKARSDLTIFRIVIDRPGASGIDFHSPVAEQFQLDYVPCFKIYDGTSGLVLAKGPEAKEMVKSWMIEERIAR